MSTARGSMRALREARGLSQLELAQVAGLSRQSVSAIEAGRSMPAVDVALRLARALDAKVEDLFGEGDEGATRVRAELLRAGPGAGPGAGPARVALAKIHGRFVACPLGGHAVASRADGITRRSASGHIEIDALTALRDAEANVVLIGCAPALGLIADAMRAHSDRGRVLWVPGSSTQALAALGKRHAHVAGVHLVDARTGEANVADVRKQLARARKPGVGPVSLVTLASWQVGLVLARGNPLRVTGVRDLGRRGLRLVTREEGSGARRLLDRELLRAGLSRVISARAALSAPGQLEVAQLVALGAADVGIATLDAALAFGLCFVPLAEERYDLVLPAAFQQDPRAVRLLELLASGGFRRELSLLGYDAAASGARVAEVSAA